MRRDELSAALPLLAAALACALLVYLVSLAAPGVPLAPEPAFAIAFTAVALELCLFARLAPALSPATVIVVTLAAAGALVALSGAAARGVAPAVLTVVLGTSGALVGARLGAGVEKLGQLTAVALVSSLADLWSVLDPTGPSARLAQRVLAEPERLSPFALPFPLLGSALVPGIIGAGDLVFAALYVAAFRAHGAPLGRVVLALLVGFAAGLAALLLLKRPLPLLPLLGGAVLACDPAARSLSGREWRTVLAVCAALLGVLALRLVR